MTDSDLRAVDIIAKKQRGESLTRREISWFVQGSARGVIPDYQISAFLMAVYFKSMDLRETRDLVEAMIASGEVLALKSIRATKVDKHSTGGVGDKISLIVGPLVASVGVHVPMVSGRALGHTGGTLDKLESIPGFRTDLGPAEFERAVKRVGIAIIGQTDKIAPADRKFYAIRDVTSTIVCPPLIVSSILSKKIASGTDAIVFDIKAGNGAFMGTASQAVELAKLLTRVAAMLGKRTSAIVTRMDEPLGHCVGNAIEIRESIEVLKGRWVEDLVTVSLALGSEMLLLAGRAKTRSEALTLLRSALLGGKGLQKFRDMVKAQHGDVSVVADPAKLPRPRATVRLLSPRNGFVSHIEAMEVGRIAILLGAGRVKSEDDVDPAAGIEFLKKRGDRVVKGEVLALLHTRNARTGRRCAGLLEKAISFSSRRPEPRPLVIGKVIGDGLKQLDGAGSGKTASLR
ncbi:MAG TPA: thymidine phosphorylase [bacterium]|nr:thymidine phosphorylase [bacterium]